MEETVLPGDRKEATGPILRLLPYQQQVLDCPERFTWSCWARQTGKSFTLSLRRVLRGLARRRTQLFLSAGMRQTRELMLKVRQHCQALHVETSERTGPRRAVRAGGSQVELPGGVRLIGLPARPETVRGYSGDVLLDEFAMHGDDRAVWAAIFPTVLRGQGELDVASTPKGRDNLFYRLRENDSFARSTLTLPEAIAQGLDADIDALRKAMGDDELFRQEFLCEFLDESQAFLPHRVIAACEDETVEKDVDWARLRQDKGDLYAGIDVARKRDFTVIWLWRMHRAPEAQRHRQEATATEGGPRPIWSLRCAGLVEMGNTTFAEQQEVIRRVLQLACVRRCCIDATGMGLPLAEWAQEEFGLGRVEAVHFTAASKSQMAGQLRRLAEEGRLRIPADEILRNDWHSVRRMVGAGGSVRLDGARTEGGHADRFWAAALGAHAVEAAGSSGPVEGIVSGGARLGRRMW